MDSLTDAAVERRVAARVREKADAHDWGGGGATPASVVAVFVDWLMPLTKAAQVRYFMRRLDGGGFGELFRTFPVCNLNWTATSFHTRHGLVSVK